MHDVTERRRAEKRLAHQAMHDPSPACPTAHCCSTPGHALAAVRRDGGAVATLLVALDHFKSVNDSLGYEVGDELLMAVGNRLKETIRAADTVGRSATDSVAHLGATEFAVLCERLSRERDAIRIADRTGQALRPPFVLGGERVFVSASIGIALSSGGAPRGSRSPRAS